MEAFRMQEHDIINMTYKFAEEYHASVILDMILNI